MKLLIRTILAITLCQGSAWAQQNAFTFGDNGTFEGTAWEGELETYNAPNNYLGTVSRISPANKIDGDWVLRVETAQRTNSSLRNVIYFPYQNQTNSFALSFWIYFPYDENTGENAGINLTHMTLEPRSYVSVTTGGTTFCDQGLPPSNTLQFNKWIQITPGLSDKFAFFTNFYSPDPGAKLVFYIDKIEAHPSTPILDNVQFGENAINLNPSGGLSIIPDNSGDIHGPLYYSYAWENGSTSQNRSGLTPGVIYSVTITHGKNWGTCTETAYFQYISGRPTPPNVTNAQLCEGDQTQLVASSPTPQGYYSFAWYDSPTGGNLISTGSTLNTGVLSPGTHKYYAQINISGSIKGESSYRTEATVTVHPTPAPQLSLSSSVIFKDKPLTITANNHQPGYSYSYFFRYGSGDGQESEIVATTDAQLSYTFHDLGPDYLAIGLHDIDVTVSDLNGCTATYSFTVEVKNIVPLCETIIPTITTNDYVKLDKFSGQYVFQRNQNCAPDISFGCIQGKVEMPQLKNVVSAAATTFSDKWNYNLVPNQPTATGSAVERGEAGKWRPLATYAYNKGGVSVDKNYNSGRFQLAHFNWQAPEANTKAGWLKVNQITRYSPQGEAIEELNALNVPSAAKFGYHHALPYMIAQNADYNSVLFESFENTYSTNMLEDGVTVNGGTTDASVYHSGAKSLKLTTQFTSRPFYRSRQAEAKGLLVRVWAKVGNQTNALKLSLTATQTLQRDFSLIARSGEWSLWEALVEPNSFSVNDSQTFQVSIQKVGVGNVWIDDVRIQPLDAEMTCYVYDVKTLRVLTVLDDQHFGLYYQYNSEGKLVRKLVETTRGIKTVQETQYNTPLKDKTEFIGQ